MPPLEKGLLAWFTSAVLCLGLFKATAAVTVAANNFLSHNHGVSVERDLKGRGCGPHCYASLSDAFQ